MLKGPTNRMTVGRKFFFAAILATSAFAGTAGAQTGSGLSVEAQCDAAAGSRYDRTRNTDFAPVEADDIRLGVALSACREAFNAGGNARMAFQLARALEKAGQDLEALKLYGEAVKRGHTVAMVNYGALLGARGDAASEFGFYKKAAEAGDLLGAYNLGVAYRDGIGTEIDGAEAARWFEKTAADGDETAAFNLGVLLDDGSLVKEDNARAAAYYRLAAGRGNVDAMINLGLMLESAEGVPQDLSGAAQMFSLAAAKGDSYGTFKLGLMQQNGTGIVRNIEDAVQSLVAAFELKDVDLEVLLRDRPSDLSAEARLAIKRVLAERKLIAEADNAEIDPITLGAIEKHYGTETAQK